MRPMDASLIGRYPSRRTVRGAVCRNRLGRCERDAGTCAVRVSLALVRAGRASIEVVLQRLHPPQACRSAGATWQHMPDRRLSSSRSGE